MRSLSPSLSKVDSHLALAPRLDRCLPKTAVPPSANLLLHSSPNINCLRRHLDLPRLLDGLPKMATPTVIEIPKTKSAAADPSARSFLTTLPPEIRNRIYEYVFKSDEPVLPRDGHVFLERFRHEYSIDCGQRVVEKGFRHGLSGCVGLLLSCRQVYHEAVGILYGQNHFMVSLCPSQQANSTCKWLVSIGSNYELLSRVSIDTDGLEISSEAFELLPLLKLIWNHAQAKCEFAFVSGSSLSQERNNGAGYHDPITAADLMNRALVELGTADVLNLRQYAKYSGLISSIMIWHHEDDRFGYVEYKDSTIPHSFPHPGRCFDISDHGSKIQWKESEQLSLLSLTYEFLSAIKRTYAHPTQTLHSTWTPTKPGATA